MDVIPTSTRKLGQLLYRESTVSQGLCSMRGFGGDFWGEGGFGSVLGTQWQVQ